MISEKRYQYTVIILLIIIMYFRVVSYDFNLDDYIITKTLEGKVNQLNDLPALLKLTYNNTDYRPVVFLSFGIEHLLFNGIHAPVSHAVNIFLYSLICISAIKLFQMLFGKEQSLLLFMAVILYAVHPLNTEVVCSIKCRDNLLSMFFGMNSTIFFLQYIQHKSKKYLYLVISLILSLLGILSKLDAFGFVIFNFGFILFAVKEKKIDYLIVSFLFFILIIILSKNIPELLLENTTEAVLKGKVTYTENPMAVDFSFSNRIIAFINTIYFYFTRIIPLSGFRYYYGFNSLSILAVYEFSFAAGICIIAGLVSLFIYSLLSNLKIITVALMAIFILVFYALNLIVPVAGIIADRYIFMANLFFCLFTVSVLYYGLRYLNKTFLFLYVVTAIGIIFFIQTTIRIPVWKNQKTLIDADAPKLLNSYEAMRIAASTYYTEYEKENNEQTKIEYLRKAIYYAEKGCAVYPENAVLNLMLGQYYFKNGQNEKAVSIIRESVKHDSLPLTGFRFLGDIYYNMNMMDSSLIYYEKGLQLAPESQELINNISTVYYESKGKEACLEFNKRLLEKDSTLYPAYENLGYYYLNENDSAKAKLYFNKAVRYGLSKKSLPSFRLQ